MDLCSTWAVSSGVSATCVVSYFVNFYFLHLLQIKNIAEKRTSKFAVLPTPIDRRNVFLKNIITLNKEDEDLVMVSFHCRSKNHYRSTIKLDPEFSGGAHASYFGNFSIYSSFQELQNNREVVHFCESHVAADLVLGRRRRPATVEVEALLSTFYVLKPI